MIGNSVTSIGDNVFSACELEKIQVVSGNQLYDSRGECNAIIETQTNSLIVGCKSTKIPSSVTSIGDNAFSYCSGLASVSIPNSVTSIGFAAFFGCNGLTSVAIGNSLTSIGERAFKDCKNLTSVIFNAEKCTQMGSQILPVFSGCNSLKTLTIGERVTMIPDYAFDDCPYVVKISVSAKNPPVCGGGTEKVPL